MTSIRRKSPSLVLDYAKAEILQDALFDYHISVGRTLRILRQNPDPSDEDKYKLVGQTNLEQNVGKLYREVSVLFGKMRAD